MNWLLTKTRHKDDAKGYIDWVRNGNIHVDFASADEDAPSDLSSFDALLLPGGGDINPSCYGREPEPEPRKISNERDALELDLIRRFLGVRKPIFGVCRGIQVINVYFGGKLIQDVPRYLSAVPGTAQPEEHDSDRKGHDAKHGITLLNRGLLATALYRTTWVNSAHHQAIHPDGVARELQVAAVSKAGIIEAVEGVGLPSPVVAVQWHPERLPWAHAASSQLLQLMVNLAGGQPFRNLDKNSGIQSE